MTAPEQTVRWHLHRWSRWEDYDQAFIDKRSGREWLEPMQRRRCWRCGLRQERTP